jgi:4-alpha-glucanotransferase
VVNLEDLLGETRPQNLPGTGAEWENWRRKIAGSEADVKREIAAAAAWFTAEKAGPG